MKLDFKATEKKWFTFKDGDEEAEFCIRPFPLSSLDLSEGKTFEALWVQFDYCLVDWKGLVDDDNEPVKVNKSNKKKIFDFFDDIREFVFKKAREIAKRQDEELKNS